MIRWEIRDNVAARLPCCHPANDYDTVLLSAAATDGPQCTCHHERGAVPPAELTAWPANWNRLDNDVSF